MHESPVRHAYAYAYKHQTDGIINLPTTAGTADITCLANEYWPCLASTRVAELRLNHNPSNMFTVLMLGHTAGDFHKHTLHWRILSMNNQAIQITPSNPDANDSWSHP